MNNRFVYVLLIMFFVLLNNRAFSQTTLTNTNSIVSFNKEKVQALVHLVKQDCGSCHGMTLKGGLGPALLPEDLKGKSTLFIQNTILHGRPGTAMPPWKSILTKEEARWISTQLQQGLTHD